MKWAVAALLAAGLCAGAALAADGNDAGGVVIYGKDNAPKAPKLEDLPLKEAVSQYGITWTFEQPARVGQFVNGDFYVVGPVTIRSIDPKPLFGEDVPKEELDTGDQGKKGVAILRNGSMLNPPAKNEAALDSGTKNWYVPALAAKLPIAMKPSDTLVSSISMKQDEKAVFVYGSSGSRGKGDNSCTRVAAVLTCVAEPLPADAFRPSYGDRQAKVYFARDLRRDQLLKLDKVKGAPDPAKFAEVFRKCWFNPAYFGFEQPMENMPHYGQSVGQAVSDAGLLLCMDFTPQQKERLLVNFVQVGIDYWGLVKSGHPGWQGWGGHDSGRKFPIVLAGWLLGDAEMASPTKGFPKCEFGEDNQTRYGQSWTGATVVFAGHSGVSSATGQPPRKQWGPYEQMNPSEWDKDGMANHQSEAYRRANTSCCWVGEALVMRVLKLEKEWNHDSFFDYVDRWMTEDDKAFRHEIGKYFPKDTAMVDDTKTWYQQGYTGEEWIKEVWAQDRTAAGMPPTDGWKKPHAPEVP
jgi:hypothetical protein